MRPGIHGLFANRGRRGHSFNEAQAMRPGILASSGRWIERVALLQ